MTPLIRASARMLDLILPSYCWCCRCPLPSRSSSGIDLCETCADEVERWFADKRDSPDKKPSFVDSANAVFEYGPAVATILLALKYGERFEIAGPIGRAMAAVALSAGLGFASVVVPVPTSRARFRRRGYNPAALLARIVSRELGIPMADGGLRRVRDPGSMGGVGREERLRRIAGCFDVMKGMRGESILLIDDVLTTGATVSECSRVLRSAGAIRIDVITAARVPGNG